MNCPNCGFEIPDDSTVCNICGAPLTENLPEEEDNEEQVYSGRQKYNPLEEKTQKINIPEEQMPAEEKSNRLRLVIAAVCVALILTVSAVFAVKYVVPRSTQAKYESALSLVGKGEYIKAYEMMSELKDYENSEKIRTELHNAYELQKNAKKIAPGDTITFGRYEQDNNEKNGAEDIEWIVLDKQDRKILVLSKKILCRTTRKPSVVWCEKSDREWLNSSFIKEALNQYEQKITADTTITCYGDGDKKENVTVVNKLFYLSPEETEKYNLSVEAGSAEVTEYASSATVGFVLHSNKWYWTLRTDNSVPVTEQVSGFIGSIVDSFTGNGIYGVRPAMWIETE